MREFITEKTTDWKYHLPAADVEQRDPGTALVKHMTLPSPSKVYLLTSETRTGTCAGTTPSFEKNTEQNNKRPKSPVNVELHKANHGRQPIQFAT